MRRPCMASGAWSGTKSTAGSAVVSPTATQQLCAELHRCGRIDLKHGDGYRDAAGANAGTGGHADVDHGGRPAAHWAGRRQNATSCTASGAWSGDEACRGGSDGIADHDRQLCTELHRCGRVSLTFGDHHRDFTSANADVDGNPRRRITAGRQQHAELDVAERDGLYRLRWLVRHEVDSRLVDGIADHDRQLCAELHPVRADRSRVR